MGFRKRRLLLALGLLIGLLVGLPSWSYVVARRTVARVVDPLPEGFAVPADVRFDFWMLPTFEGRQLAWRFTFKHPDVTGDGVQFFVSPTGELLVTNPISLLERIEEMPSPAQFREFVQLAESFVEAAAAGDTVTLQSLCEGDQPVGWALWYRASEPQLFTEAAGQLKVRIGARRGDVGVGEIAVVEFGFPYEGKRESLGIQFVRLGETWKIQRAQLTNR